MVESSRQPLLAVRGLDVSIGDAAIVRGAEFEMAAGEALGIVGESGAGKSTLLKAVAGLLPPGGRIVRGQVLLDGEDIAHAPAARLRRLRGGAVSYLFQNGPLSLDPLFTIGRQFDEAIRAHGGLPDAGEERALLRKMGMEDPGRVLASLPSELSGGLCQRCALAFALAGRPRLLLADEPTSSLDAASRDQVGSLLARLNREQGMAIVLVGHDIGFVASLAARIIVMRGGAFVEEGPAGQVLAEPRDPYTRALVDAVPRARRAFVRVDGPEAAFPGTAEGAVAGELAEAAGYAGAMGAADAAGRV